MGNHAAGHLIDLYARQFAAARMPGESAREVLDKAMQAAKASPDFSGDAEFEAQDPDRPGYVHPDYSRTTHPHPKAVLGMLLIEAFAPNGMDDLARYAPMLTRGHADEDKACAAWWDEIYMPFKAQYGLY